MIPCGRSRVQKLVRCKAILVSDYHNNYWDGTDSFVPSEVLNNLFSDNRVDSNVQCPTKSLYKKILKNVAPSGNRTQDRRIKSQCPLNQKGVTLVKIGGYFPISWRLNQLNFNQLKMVSVREAIKKLWIFYFTKLISFFLTFNLLIISIWKVIRKVIINPLLSTSYFALAPNAIKIHKKVI